MICPKFSYWGKCWVRWEQSCKQVAVEKDSENRKREPRVPKSWQPVTLFTAIKRSKSFWVQSSICRQAWACYHICMKLNLQNQGVSHWSDNACSLKQRCWLGKSGPEGSFYHHDMWRIMHEHHWALWAVEIMFCVQQWLATDCFEMDNHNFHLHSLENNACERSDSTFKKNMREWPNPLALNTAVGEADCFQITSICKANSSRVAYWHFIIRANLLAVEPPHVWEWTKHSERHNLCHTVRDSLGDLANGPTLS